MDQVMQNCKRGVSTGTCKSKLKFSYNKLLSASAYIVKTVKNCLTKGQEMEPLYMPQSNQGHNNTKF